MPAKAKWAVGDLVHLKADTRKHVWRIHQIKRPDGPYRIIREHRTTDSLTGGMNAYPEQLIKKEGTP